MNTEVLRESFSSDIIIQPRPEPCGGDGRLVLHGVDRGAIRVGAGGELQREAEEQSQPSLYSVHRKHQ